MNRPPLTCIRVPHRQLHQFVLNCAQNVGMPAGKAELLAQLLTTNDLRGIFSHGTRLIATYARSMQRGSLNPSPEVRLVNETPVSMLLDGDGGLGYFPAYEGTLALIEKAKQQGIAVLATCNHGHIGAAGIYARLPLEHDMVTFVTSGHQLFLLKEETLHYAAGGSPMAFSAPAGEEDSQVLDFGTMNNIHPKENSQDELARMAPGMVLRSIGLGAVCQAWGGLLTGLPIRAKKDYKDVLPQGALVITFKINLFISPKQFKREVDQYVRMVRSLKPLAGFDQAYLPGGVEAANERQFRQEGIPVGPEHQQQLEHLANELGISVPWRPPAGDPTSR